jgi:mono/diheme cytochrome c family protein
MTSDLRTFANWERRLSRNWDRRLSPNWERRLSAGSLAWDRWLLASALSLFLTTPSYATPVEDGKKIFTARNCAICHSVNEVGGCLAPPLDGIGKRRGKEFIQSRITNTPEAIAKFAKLYRATELMPHLRLPPKQANDVVAYLMTFQATPGTQLKSTSKNKSAAPIILSNTRK